MEWQATPDITGYDQSLYTNIGRFFQVGATYRFWAARCCVFETQSASLLVAASAQAFRPRRLNFVKDVTGVFRAQYPYQLFGSIDGPDSASGLHLPAAGISIIVERFVCFSRAVSGRQDART